ncbi:hypothetical protein G6M89_10065 [Natronolimnobius sp. AArcel1]|uniref:hypothetical protein n=1 Tax=Natronolimnobius sp. AArcel1 TaxID=1679093 RepID=UPI0013ECA961|nr:hypothetical protein [Natronolimnobius sp. AArcel1]NGM69347.1 hypothetical protein [Natronolimnobius sp. AArcel1]
MADASSDGVSRLGKSGIGVICGGVLFVVGTAILSFSVLSTLVFGCGIIVLLYSSSMAGTQAGIGLAAVGGIGLLESLTPVGVGIGPELLGLLAITFGVFDILASVVLRFVRPT